ncbi:MAG TPA: hypothetical protein VFP89_03330 [Propionibacteriaceae bacterium]|nr:hypothetical protein [Propionibacteriaceae bacterium]
MTVVLALRCADGIVLGADSQVTDSARGLSYPSQKLHPFGGTAGWGGSGARAVLMELEEVFDSCATAVLGAENVGRAVQERVIPLLRHHYDTFIERVPPRTPPKRCRRTTSRAYGSECGDGPSWRAKLWTVCPPTELH